MPPLYSPLPTVPEVVEDKQFDLEASHRRQPKTTFKKIIFYVLAIFAIMYALVLGVKEIPSACRMLRSKAMLMKNGTNMSGCHGANRTISTGAGLPSFYTLPSGDKIPSVALGKYTHNPLQSLVRSSLFVQVSGVPILVMLVLPSRFAISDFGIT